MATNLVPVISGTVDYDKSPLHDPPATVFPYPEREAVKRTVSRDRLDSDATLTEGEVQKPHDNAVNKVSTEPAASNPVHRPTISKYDTELVRPVVGRPFIAGLERRSTGGRPSGEPFQRPQRQQQQNQPRIAKPDDGHSSDGFSSDEDPTDTAGQDEQHPTYKELSKAQLNKVKQSPRQHKLSFGNEHFKTRGKVARDGRLNIALNETTNSGYLAKALGATLKGHLHPHTARATEQAAEYKRQYAENKGSMRVPRMNIVIMVIGSRGDIQPFLKIGKILKDKYGHRVRIATHPTFKKFVQEEIGLEFFSIGGDPSELMAWMVKNPGLIPSFDSIKEGEVGRRRDQMYEMFQGFWRACINATDDEKDFANLKMMGNKAPFVADAIIANPVSFAPLHCAEKLGIPLHQIFTFPFSPTTSFPHPLANIKSTNVDHEYANFMSYPLVELMTWQGLGDLINRFRVKTLGLDPVSTLWAPGQASRLKIPMTYLWSPGLVPKPADWGPEIDIAGYVFLDLGGSYKPADDLKKFLERSDDTPLLYVGFGSISGLDDPTAFCKMIFEAVEKANVKAVVSRGWGGMGDGLDKPDNVFLLDSVPHDWLFPQVDAVVHHGGAGTTAAGLRYGKPTMIVPFFGDQPFWAAMIARAGAGAREALPLKKLDSDKFAEGIRQCLEPEVQAKAMEIAKSIEAEGDGADNAVDSFHRSLPLSGKNSMRCGIFEDRVAAWKVKHTQLQLSSLAADLLVENRQLTWLDLQLIRHKDWTDFQGPGEPITGVGGVLVASFQEALHGLTSISDMTKRDMKRIEKRKRRQKLDAEKLENSNQKVNPAGTLVPSPDGAGIGGQTEARDMNGAAGQSDFVVLSPSSEPQSRPPNPRAGTTLTSMGETLPAPVVIAKDVGKGVGHSAKVIAMLPLDILMAIALGFRNAPRLYGDRTVRPPPPSINGFRRGWAVAGQELWYGFYDGVTGLVRNPRRDMQEDGFAGLPKGVARGAGGLILKPVAGIMGVPAYTTRGCVEAVRRTVKDTGKTERFLRRGRMSEGAKDVIALKKDRHDAKNKTKEYVSKTASQLEDARLTVLTRWTSREREMVQEARQQDRGNSIIPLKLKPDRSQTV